MIKQLLVPALSAALLAVAGVVSAAESHDHGAATATAGADIAATGTVKSVDAAKGKLVIDHEPIPALHWPRMVMDFQLVDKAMAEQVKAGDKVNFTLTPGEKKGSYTVTALEPAR
ncbi:MAG: copper-binding protein [Candidatus Competibacter sp.]|nr:copper-binding protein [Candidatus Competibacter sp.]MDG4583526.1 copper-binding protein [Candidatus Competibacter sp.]